MVEKSNCYSLQTRSRMEKQRKRCYCKNRLIYHQSKKILKKKLKNLYQLHEIYILEDITLNHCFIMQSKKCCCQFCSLRILSLCVFFSLFGKQQDYSKVLKQCKKTKQWKNNIRNFAHERKFLKLHKYVLFKIQLPLPDFKPWWTR